MLNFIKQIGLILLFALLSSSGSVFAANEAENGNAGIPQQNQRVKGKIQDAMGPIHLWKVLTMSRPGKVLRVASN